MERLLNRAHRYSVPLFVVAKSGTGAARAGRTDAVLVVRGGEGHRALRTLEPLNVRRCPGDERRLLDRVDLSAVEAGPVDRELVRRDVHAVRVNAEQRLVAFAGATRVRLLTVAAVVRHVEAEEVPVRGTRRRIPRLARRDLDRPGASNAPVAGSRPNMRSVMKKRFVDAS